VSAEHVLALDLGTTGVRALLIAADGTVRARAYRKLETRFPQVGWVEQDPADMWSQSVDVLREALRSARLQARDVAALGVVTQRATVVAWDARDGAPLAPAQSWQDMRTAERVAELRASGIPVNTMASAVKLSWWLEHDAELAKAAAAGRLRFGTPDAWLTWCLTGGAAHVTEPGQASCTALFDPATCDWSDGLCGLFAVPRELLPEIRESSGVVGGTEAALLGGSIPVAARAGDQQASAFGQGVHEPGDAKCTLGTSAMIDVHTGTVPGAGPPASFPLALWRLASSETCFCLEGQVLTAGAAVDWLVDLGVATDAAEVDRLASEVESSEGVRFVPALQGLGTPYGEDGARGLFAGLTRGSSGAHLARAVLEGVAHRCADVLDALGVAGPLRLDGGLGRSDFVVQAIADFSNRTLLRATETEATSLGAAWLAALAVAPRLPASDREHQRALWHQTVARALP
jgi:glycerol kinase